MFHKYPADADLIMSGLINKIKEKAGTYKDGDTGYSRQAFGKNQQMLPLSFPNSGGLKL
jgi:hypothetical protein